MGTETEAAEEAEWELATAETLLGKGDVDGARSWFRRAADHLMDAGQDDRALEVLKRVSTLSPSTAPPALEPAPSKAPAPPPPPPAKAVEPAPAAPPPPPTKAVEPAPAAPPPPPTTKAVEATVVEKSPAPAVVAPVEGATPPSEVGPVLEKPAPLASLIATVAPERVPTPEPVARAASPASKSVPSAPPPEDRADDEYEEEAPVPARSLRAAERPAASPSPPPVVSSPAVPVAMAWDPGRAATADATAALLVALPLFADLSAERVRSLARESVIVTMTAGQEVASPSPADPPSASPLWVITEGHVHLAVGATGVGAPLGPGDFFGEVPAFLEAGCLLRAEARTNGKALCVAPTVVQALARECESLRTALEESAWERAFAALGHGASLFAALDPALRAKLYARFEPVQVEPGVALLTEGEKASWVWLVAAGSVERYGGPLGAKVQRAGVGAAVGVAAAWHDAPSGASVRVRRRTYAARLAAEAFRAMATEVPSLAGARLRADVW